MKKYALITAIIFLFSINGFAQFSLNNVYIMSSNDVISFSNFDKSFKTQLLNGFTLPFALDSYNTYSTDMRSNKVGLHISFNKPIKKVPYLQQHLRAGIQLGSWNVNLMSKHTNTQSIVDTLTSSNTGDEFYVHNNFVKASTFQLVGNSIGVVGDYLVYLKPARKLSLYGGIGMNLNLLFNSKVIGSLLEYNYTDYNNMQNNNAYHFENIKTEKNIGNGYNMSANAILGINYRLSNRSKVLQHFNLFAEVKKGISFTKFSGATTQTDLFTGFNAGVRISINEVMYKKKK